MPDASTADYKDALRMPEVELLRIINERTAAQGSERGAMRGTTRMTLGPGINVPALFEQPGGSQSRVLLRAIDISPMGVGVLHGGFVHMGTRVKLHFPTPDGETFMAEGEVQRAQHIKGRVHELGIAFTHRIDVGFIVEDDSQEKHYGVTAAIKEVGGIAKRIHGVSATASSPRDMEQLIAELNTAWSGVLEAEASVIACEQAETDAKIKADTARELADAIERGSSPEELRQMFEVVRAAIANKPAPKGPSPETGESPESRAA